MASEIVNTTASLLDDGISSQTPESPGAKPLLPLFMTLTFVSIFLNAVLIFLSMRSSDFRRVPAFVNLSAIFILWGVGYGFLTIVGFPNDQDPPLALCMVQAGAVYGNVIMLAVGYLTLQVEFWFLVRKAITPFNTFGDSKIRVFVALSLPYVAYFVVFVARFFQAAQDTELVTRTSHTFYCTIEDNNVFGTTLRVTVAILGSAGLGIGVWTIHIFCQAYQGTARTNKMLWVLLLRIAIFSFWVGICVVVAIVEIIISGRKKPYNAERVATMVDSIPDLLVATVPLVHALLFITQKDFRHIATSIFRGRRARSGDPESPSSR